MPVEIVEVVNVTYPITWQPWVVQYFFIIGLSYGAFLLSLPGVVAQKAAWKTASYYALIIAVVCALVAPLSLLADLHQPQRFLNFYLHFQSSSWMAWGAVFLLFYIFSVLGYAWLGLRPVLAQAGRAWSKYVLLARALAGGGQAGGGALKFFAALAFISALTIIGYTSAEFMTVAARPLWHHIAIPVLYFLSAIFASAGAVLVACVLTGAGDRSLVISKMSRMASLSALLALVTAMIWWLSAKMGFSAVAAQALEQLLQHSHGLSKMLTLVGLLFLVFVMGLLKGGRAWGVLLGLLALATAWLLRWNVFITGQELPKTGAGSYAYDVAFAADTWLGVAGSLGLIVFLFILLTSIVPSKYFNNHA